MGTGRLPDDNGALELAELLLYAKARLTTPPIPDGVRSHSALWMRCKKAMKGSSCLIPVRPHKISRRRFLGSQAAIAAIGATPFLGTAVEALGATSTPTAPAKDYYDILGVGKFINAAGTYTALTSATMPPVVQAAVAEAAKHPVHLAELQQKSGEYIANKLKCEGALVSCGASSALSLATAACVQSANGCSAMDIPQEIGTKFPKNEVIMMKAHRYGYDHGMFITGIKVVEVVTLDDYKKAFNANTVMTNFFNAADGGDISREDWLKGRT